MSDRTAVVHGANEVATVRDGELESVGGDGSADSGAVAIVDGRVAAVGPSATITRSYPPENASVAIDATGKAVLPGFVDSHTHAVFAGDRADEFAAKLRGKSYQEILAEGGGILRTVRATREASIEELVANLREHVDEMLRRGTTTVEVKSGYGLDVETELRLLEAIDRADEGHPVDLVPTFMGAHAVPTEADATSSDGDRPQTERASAYVDRVVADQLPAVANQGIAEFCDVFCEADVFSVDQSRRVLEAGAEHGLRPKVHAEEFTRLGGAQLAAEVEAVSADHLLHATDEDFDTLQAAAVTPVFLPTTAFGLGSEYADARSAIDEGCNVAIATDFNPNCYSESMAFAIALACVEMEMTPAEAIVAATDGGARALAREGLGTLQPATAGDLVVLDAPTHVHIPYSYGRNRVDTVLKGGRPVVRNGDRVSAPAEWDAAGDGGNTDV